MPSEPAVWDSFAAIDGGVLVVGHGTRNPVGAAQLLKLTEQLRAFLPGIPLAGCFLELAQPSIEIGVHQLAVQGVREILVVPVLLFRAGHAKDDIPQAVAAAASQHAMRVFGQSYALGTHQAVLRLSAKRFRDALAPALSNVKSVGLAMAGRGASDQRAVLHMGQLTRLRIRQTPVDWHTTGFFAIAQPSIDEMLEQASQTPCTHIVVQPHLLFEGELTHQLDQKVSQYQAAEPHRNWITADVLGSDQDLASTFLELAQSVVLRKLSSND